MVTFADAKWQAIWTHNGTRCWDEKIWVESVAHVIVMFSGVLSHSAVSDCDVLIWKYDVSGNSQV